MKEQKIVNYILSYDKPVNISYKIASRFIKIGSLICIINSHLY